MMAFGNMGDDCGTGVAFTRNPATGEKGLMGEFLMNAQGEDVVAGVRTPMPISQMAEVLPDVYKQFLDVCKTLESHYRDMQDMEFTIERGKLFMLQTRNGKRTAAAAIRIACDLIDEGMINEKEALLQIDAKLSICFCILSSTRQPLKRLIKQRRRQRYRGVSRRSGRHNRFHPRRSRQTRSGGQESRSRTS